MLLILAGLLVVGGTGYAHHSFSATYDQTTEITIEGKLVQFLFRNPHAFVHVEAPDKNGVMQRWAIEWGGTNELLSQGIRRDTFKVGDEVVIKGNPVRNPAEHKLRMNTLLRKRDGFGWGERPGEVVN
jgi:hypothetical protein